MTRFNRIVLIILTSLLAMSIPFWLMGGTFLHTIVGIFYIAVVSYLLYYPICLKEITEEVYSKTCFIIFFLNGLTLFIEGAYIWGVVGLALATLHLYLWRYYVKQRVDES